MNDSFNSAVNFDRSANFFTRRRFSTLAWLSLALALAAFPAKSADADSAQANPPQGRRGGGEIRGVYKARVAPHWFSNNTRFWYRNDLTGGTKEFILVNAEKGTRSPAFDHEKLATALSKAAKQEYKAKQLPFSDIEFSEDNKAVQFEVASKQWKCDLSSYRCTEVAGATNAFLSLPSAIAVAESANDEALDSDTEASAVEDDEFAPPQDQAQGQQRGQGGQGGQAGRGLRGRGQGGGGGGAGRGFGGRGFNAEPQNSPDGKWTALVKEYNVYLRSQGENKEEYQLTQDGATNNSYGRLEWSPDSRGLVAWRIQPGEQNPVYLVRSSPQVPGPAALEQRSYPQAGNRFTAYELSVFDVATRKQSKPEADPVDFGSPNLRWKRETSRFTYEKVDRGHQRFRVIEVDAAAGTSRNIIDEKTKTFIWTAHTESWSQNQNLRMTTYLDDTDEIVYASEQDGWRHLYLIDAKTGKVKNQITKGEWVVRGFEPAGVDAEKRQIWFRASGKNSDEDPYFIHCYRVNFDGTGLVALTEGNGTHTVQYSPDRKYLIDTYSRVDMPPVNQLRRVSDGKLVSKLEETDISELKASGWEPPEVFVSKARDGKTDIWGNIYRPRNLDPNKKYAILEDIYAGPHDSFTPKSFSGGARYEAYNRLGFIVVKLDGMGTANRSKAFHDVCWHNIKDAGFPDRILWMKAAAAKYHYMDTDRVGIWGTSAGGQNAAAALLFHPEFYKAAVANCGCHDNRLDKASWNEQWMGYLPPDKIWSNDPENWFSQCSNIDNAARLKGHLFLIVGEMDTNVPPESTMRFVDALVRARKDFDMLVVPNANHGAGSAITGRRTQDFLVKHLLGTDPPNRNTDGDGGGTTAATGSAPGI